MLCIRVATPPLGEAPEEVRARWVGLVLPLDQDELIAQKGAFHGVLTGAPENYHAFRVPKLFAIEILALAAPDACEWWLQNTDCNDPFLVLGFNTASSQVTEQLPSVTRNAEGDELRVWEFLTQLEDEGESGPSLQMELREQFGDNAANELFRSGLTRPAVLLFAEMIAAWYGETIHQCTDDALRVELHAEGHSFLASLHRLATENKIDLLFAEIDRPLSSSDHLSETDVPRSEDGNGSALTGRTMRILRSLGR